MVLECSHAGFPARPARARDYLSGNAITRVPTTRTVGPGPRQARGFERPAAAGLYLCQSPSRGLDPNYRSPRHDGKKSGQILRAVIH